MDFADSIVISAFQATYQNLKLLSDGWRLPRSPTTLYDLTQASKTFLQQMPQPQKWDARHVHKWIWKKSRLCSQLPQGFVGTKGVHAKFEAAEDFRLFIHEQGKVSLWKNMTRSSENRKTSSASAWSQLQRQPRCLAERGAQALKQFHHGKVITFFNPFLFLSLTQTNSSQHDFPLHRYE